MEYSSYRTDKTGGYIKKIVFNNGTSVSINKNDIVVFVGPNNSGKSQSLKDIFSLCEKKKTTMVVSDVEIEKFDKPITAFLDSLHLPVEDRGDSRNYQAMNKSVFIHKSSEDSYKLNPYYDEFRDLFVVELNTAARLTICQPAGNIRRTAQKSHPIHYAAFDSKYRKVLSESFRKAFGYELIPNTQFGVEIPLCIGEAVALKGEFKDEQERLEKYADILATYKQVQDQGDGIKSFTGILLYLMIDYFCTYLVDEPESFLHPPQANIMGRLIGDTVSDEQQVFISTHSEEIIKGLLSVCPERIKVIRITRKEDINEFSILDNSMFAEIWNDPLLKYSNIMSSLFHKEVVLCESDSDCKFYSLINDAIKREEGTFSETLFIHCSGKHRMARISEALKSLNVRVKVIPDIDIFNDETVFRGIIEAYGVEWDLISSKYKVLISNLHSPKDKIKRADFNSEWVSLTSTNEFLSNAEIDKLEKALKKTSKWAQLKEAGFSAVPQGDAYAAVKELRLVLEAHGIFVVPVGELECFVKEVGGHGPEWVNKLIERYPDFSDKVYDDAKNFIRSMNL